MNVTEGRRLSQQRRLFLFFRVTFLAEAKKGNQHRAGVEEKKKQKAKRTAATATATATERDTERETVTADWLPECQSGR